MLEDDYEDITSTEIFTECFSKDFDEVGWDPIEIDDSDEEAAQRYGY